MVMMPLVRRPHFENLCFKRYMPCPLQSTYQERMILLLLFLWISPARWVAPTDSLQLSMTWAIAGLTEVSHTALSGHQAKVSSHFILQQVEPCNLFVGRDLKWEPGSNGDPEDHSWSVDFLAGALFLFSILLGEVWWWGIKLIENMGTKPHATS